MTSKYTEELSSQVDVKLVQNVLGYQLFSHSVGATSLQYQTSGVSRKSVNIHERLQTNDNPHNWQQHSFVPAVRHIFATNYTVAKKRYWVQGEQYANLSRKGVSRTCSIVIECCNCNSVLPWKCTVTNYTVPLITCMS